MLRSSLVVNDRVALRQARLAAALAGKHGLQVFTLPQLVERLAGGFARLVDSATLTRCVRDSLHECDKSFAEIGPIRYLPGTSRAIASTLQKVWQTGVDLEQLRDAGPRVHDILVIDRFVRSKMPKGTLAHPDLVARAMSRVEHAKRVLGPVQLGKLIYPEPCWRPVLDRLAVLGLVESSPTGSVVTTHGRTQLNNGMDFSVPQPKPGEVSVISCADAEHEILEALRWARHLIASELASPEQVAITAITCEKYDHAMTVAVEDSRMPVCFALGRPAVTTRAGQQAAALADVLLRGLNRDRVLRALRAASDFKKLAPLPIGWDRILGASVPLVEVDQWARELKNRDDFVESVDPWPVIGPLLQLMATGVDAAEELGNRLLAGQAALLWRQALQRGPASSIETTLSQMRVADPAEPESSILWADAEAVAASPRKFTRLLGLNQRMWPRPYCEDSILPAHLVDPSTLEPVPRSIRDAEVFSIIRDSVEGQLVLSYARRDSEGRRIRPSGMVPLGVAVSDLRRSRTPEHALSGSDRAGARLDEFAKSDEAKAAGGCWRDWHRSEVTGHDGLVEREHPILERALGRVHSATSLKLLLRDPLAFVWKYALGWKEPKWIETPLVLDALDFGSLVHRILELATRDVAAAGGIVAASPEKLQAAIDSACTIAAAEFEFTMPVPPPILWQATLRQAAELAKSALTTDKAWRSDSASYVEVAFNQTGGVINGMPWDPTLPVTIAKERVAVGGVIDRLDLADDGSAARVTDYKTGKVPEKKYKPETWVLRGGEELQRVLYAAAVKQLVPSVRSIEPRLLYPRGTDSVYPLENPDLALATLEQYIEVACDLVRRGRTLSGIGSESDYNEFALAMPAQAKHVYRSIKCSVIDQELGQLVKLWEEP